jgi:hypothetical protein
MNAGFWEQFQKPGVYRASEMPASTWEHGTEIGEETGPKKN